MIDRYPEARCEAFGTSYQIILGKPRIIGNTEAIAWENAVKAIELGDTSE